MSKLIDLTKGNLFIDITNDILKRRYLPCDWDEEKRSAFHRLGKIYVCSEFMYVLGALLGDGCTFKYVTSPHTVLLVGDERFTAKYVARLNACTNKPVVNRRNSKRNFWFVQTNNFELYALFTRTRRDVQFLDELISIGGKQYALQFIEGFFDAEGCIKIVRESVRKTPKVCLDFCNTNFEYLELVRKLLNDSLGIVARYSNQNAYVAKDGHSRKKSYHLRIYKKSYVHAFFAAMHTTKLHPSKISYVNAWLELNTNASSPLRNSAQLVAN